MADRLLLMSTSPDFPLLHFVLTEGRYVLGRSSRCRLVVNDPSVSRQHAEIMVQGGAVTVRDRDSRNGVFVDHLRVVRSSAVDIGQELRFGKVSFTLANPAAALDDPDSEERTDSVSIRGSGTPVVAGLSPAQQRVLDLMTDGLSEKEIAGRLKLSPHTIHNHVRAIYQAFTVHSRPELLAKLLK